MIGTWLGAQYHTCTHNFQNLSAQIASKRNATGGLGGGNASWDLGSQHYATGGLGGGTAKIWVLGSQHRAIDGLGGGKAGQWGLGGQRKDTAGRDEGMATAGQDGGGSATGGQGGGMAGQWVLGSQHRAIDGLGGGKAGQWGLGSQRNDTAGRDEGMATAGQGGGHSATGRQGGGSVAFWLTDSQYTATAGRGVGVQTAEHNGVGAEEWAWDHQRSDTGGRDGKSAEHYLAGDTTLGLGVAIMATTMKHSVALPKQRAGNTVNLKAMILLALLLLPMATASSDHLLPSDDIYIGTPNLAAPVGDSPPPTPMDTCSPRRLSSSHMQQRKPTTLYA